MFLEKISEEEEIERAEKEEENERVEREKERVYELERLKITSSIERAGSMPTVTDGGSKVVRLKDFVPKFDPKVLGITLFFLIFKSQAEKEWVMVENRVSQLIPLLPAEVAEIIVKEPVINER